MKLPLDNYREFLRLSCVPIALALPLQLLSVYILQHWPKRHLVAGLFALPQIVINVPFAVAWVRLSINGRDSVARRSLFPFGRVERNLLFAELMISLAMGFLFVGGAGLIAVAVQNVHAQSITLTLVLILLAILFIGAGLSVFARLPLILVMVALQRYAGVLACWRLSRGIGFRTVGIVVLATLPFAVGVWVTGAILGVAANSLWCLLPAIACVLCEFLERAASFGALALIYKFQMESLQPKTESAALR